MSWSVCGFIWIGANRNYHFNRLHTFDFNIILTKIKMFLNSQTNKSNFRVIKKSVIFPLAHEEFCWNEKLLKSPENKSNTVKFSF